MAEADGALLAGTVTVPLAALVAVRAAAPATVLVTVLVTAGTTAADVTVAGDGGFGWGCDPAGWPWVRLWAVWLTVAGAPLAGDWPGPLPVPPGACPGGVPPAAGPVLWPPGAPAVMSRVTPLTADAAALAAGAAAWFAAGPDPGGGAGTLAAGGA